MKKMLLGVLVLVAIGMVQLPQALAADYVIQPGDTLVKISRVTGQTVAQLADLNGIENRDLIYAGKKIKFISNWDLASAALWCYKRNSELTSAYYKRSYAAALRNIELRNISYSTEQHSGLHAFTVLDFAKAWRRRSQQEALEAALNRKPKFQPCIYDPRHEQLIRARHE